MQRLKVLYISHLHPPPNALLENMGGMQRVSMQLVYELTQHPDVQIWPVTLETSWKYAGINTTWFLMRLWGELPVLIRQWKPHVVLFSSMVTAGLGMWLKKVSDVPLVTINHGQDVILPVSAYQKLVPKIFASLDGVISVSDATRRACLERGLDPEKGTVIPNGFPGNAVAGAMEQEEGRRRLQNLLDLDFNNLPILLTVGRLVRRKGHEWFIREVLPKLHNKVHYLVIGDGQERAAIRQAADESSCPERIHLLGRQPDEVLKAAYAAAEVFVMPNIPVPGDMEGFGIVLLEANLAGTPAVASDIEGIRDVVFDDENGYRVPVQDSGLFAEKIDYILLNKKHGLGERARTFVQMKFDWKSVAQQYIDYLRLVIQNEQRKAHAY